MVTKDFNKTFVPAFYNYFLKIKLNCDKENMLNLNSSSFQKKILPNVTSVVIYLLTICVIENGFKDNCVLKTL